ncbi:hypothetical protein FACS189450_14300 [Spirochaetia bacterium]|nr:hypothetical protein FACS189450_14300 [Spirochaetia bacterium]
MSELAVLHHEIDALPQHRVGEVLDFVGYLRHLDAQQEAQEDVDESSNDEPNEETIAAIEETRAMARGEIPSPTFHSLEELLADLRS